MKRMNQSTQLLVAAMALASLLSPLASPAYPRETILRTDNPPKLVELDGDTLPSRRVISTHEPAVRDRVSQTYNKLPLSFEANVSQRK